MADYHMLNDGVFGVGGNDIMEETTSMVNAVSYSHSAAVNTPGQGMMSQSMSGTPGQNANVMMQGMVPMQQTQSGAQIPSGGMSSYHQGAALHGYSQNEVPQKLHQYSVYGSQLQSGNMAGQYVSSGPRLHHLSDPMSSIPDQTQQSSPRTVVPNQMYQNRNMTSGHYGQVSHSNSAPAQMSQGATQYPSHYGSVQHHGMQQHPVQQVNQSADMWQNSMPHSQMTRPCMPASQSYSQHQMVPNQHGANALNHSPMTIQGQRSSTPNQSQYMSNQDYATSHAAPQQPSMQRPPVYNMNSNSVNQNGSLVGQINSASQPGLSQNLNSMSQTEQSMTFSQGHYGPSQTAANRPHYNTGTAVGNTVGLASQHVMNQQMMNVRPPVHQMGYSPVPQRVNSGQQHASSVPPGSPARLQQYHPPFSPSQGYTATQPSPRSTNPESATPPHLHYSNSQPHVQAPMSPQYRSPFPSQVTHSPQHLTPTPPAEVSAPPRTPERVLQSSTPQSQGSYHSPTHLTNATHLTSPAQGHSPGNSNAPSSLQHLEQMVLPRASTGPSTTPTATNVSPNANASIPHNSGNYYSHLSSSQHHVHHTSTADSRPQTQSPSFSHVTQALPHHTYLNQPHTAAQQSSSTVSNVPNSQPLQPNVPNISTLSNSSLLSDESTPLESSQLNSVSYNSDNSSSIPSVSASTESSISRNVNVTTTVGPIPTSDPINQMPCAPSTATDSMLNPQYNMLGKTPYQGSSSSITFEMQQIQQELQQLYGMHQSPDVHDKIKNLQDRLHYLQAQPNPPEASSSLPINNNIPDTPMSPHFQQRPMLYNSGNNAAYVHQPMLQPHAMHYKPPQTTSQPSTIVQDVVPSSQQNLKLSNMTTSMVDPMAQEQMPTDPESMMHNHYPNAGQEIMAPILLPEKTEPILDPYEMNFNDEPPPKMKRRPPKEPKPKKPKSPKTPKPPKPKKPKKGKGTPEEPIVQTEGFVPVLEPGINVETGEGVPLPLPLSLPPPLGEPVPGQPEVAEQKPKKPSRKRKPKETDGEPKEPKPKKPRKRPEKKPKQPKGGAPLPESGETTIVTENTLENITLDTTTVTDQTTTPTEKPEIEGQENPDAASKEVKDKKPSKSKSPKTPKDGTPKEPKKSTPKKKLPKIALKFTSKKKKKKALTLSDHSDVERTPPPSPTEADGITKRRSARNTERKKYTDDIELHLSDDETIELDFGQSSRNDGRLVQVVVDNHTEDYMVVEKILAIRIAQKQVDNNNGSDAENSTPETVDVEEYYVKYKNLSYIHCEWKTLEELEKGDRRFIQKVKRFKQKKETFNFFDFLEEDPFNPDYVEVDRVLDVNEVKESASFQEPNEVKELHDESKLDEDKTEVPVSSEDQNNINLEVKTEVQTAQTESQSKQVEDQKTEGPSVLTESQNALTDGQNAQTESQSALSESVSALTESQSALTESQSALTESQSALTESQSVLTESLNAEGESLNALHEGQNVQSKDFETAVIESESKEEVEKWDEDKPKEVSDVECGATTEPAKALEEETAETKTVSQNSQQETEPTVIKEDEDCKITRHYLVKWRALTYEESTWELEDDVDRDKIDQFLRFKNPPPKDKWKNKKRPRPSEWDQLPESPVYKGGNTLREYQLEGVNWLTFCWYNSQNCILADEMGLGKTIQSITFLNEIDKYGIPGPFLVIAPLSTIGNWQREFETWTDLNAITYHGSSPSRNMILEYEMYWKDEKGERIQDVYKFQIMITTFEIILTDCMELKAIPWRCVIIDEAHRLKNRNCKLLEGLRMLNTEHRVLLTGTPLQNNVEELFSLLNFLEPNRFASTEAFLEEFGNLQTESQVDKLKALLKPMMLRRLKEDVEKSLAPKEETVVEVELTNIQKKYYRAILERNFTFLTKGNCYSNMPNLMNTMMELRKCCIHPFLINGAEEQIINDYKMQHEDALESNLNAMVQASGKLVLMDKLLPRLRTDGHRVLVFSQMVRCLDILEDYLVQKRYPYERIDGRVRGNLRQAAIDRFCKPDSDRFVFLLCTRAGGLGINLTAADTVIIFDSDWNPQNDLQAQARCHRIGQSKAVKVYRLICRNTYEREMFDKASLKLGLDKAVLQSMTMKENVGVNQQMSKKEIEDLLRKGAYGALMDDDNAGDKFCEEDIDQILQRRTQVITLESGTKGSTFSKATFASASTRSDIEIDDPNFWEKWAKKANFDVDELKNRNELIIQEPRRRTQTRRFGTDDLIDLSELDTSDEDDESISCRTRASRKGSKNGRKSSRGGRGDRDDDFMEDLPPGNWTRAECYKMEKGLLTFGWGRWDECMALGQFRRRMTHKDCEEISRTILLYCLLHYKGDEKIKSFIWDLICPNYEGEERIHKNHSGLSAPVPRGRKGKKIKKETKTVDQIIEECEWTKEEVNNPDSLLNDEIYKRHLNRHSNKVLLRVRLLYYLKHEIIGDLHDQVFSGNHANEIPLFVPPADGEPPTPWWDQELDKSLLLGIYKHGFERYNLMRQDPTLCFLSRCGPPDGAALLAELNNVISNEDDLEDPSIQKDKDDEMEPLSPNSENEPPKHILPSSYMQHAFEMGMIQFPSVTDVNTRVRRLVTAFQRNNKKLEIRNAQKARKIERREKFEAAIRERELKKRELQQRKWSRREEADFYRTISSFGVEYNEEKKEYNWARFRGIARLERKYDETLAEYYKCFYAMCKRVCGRELTEEEEQLSMNVEPISEERASRCLQRVELLNKIREEILSHPELDARLKLCQPSMDLPDWWICGKHDKDLLIGAAKHGLSRMDYHLLHDPNLSFKDVLKNFPNAKTIQIGNMFSTPIGCSSPLNIYHTDENMLLKDESFRRLKEELPICADDYNLKDDIPFHKHLELSSETKKEVEDCKEKIDASSNDQIPKMEKEVTDESAVKTESSIDDANNLIKKEDIPAEENIDTKTEEDEIKITDVLKSEINASDEAEDKTNVIQGSSEITESINTDEKPELKNEEDFKVEDDETDIETDNKKEDEDNKEVMPVLEKSSEVSVITRVKSPTLSTPVLEEMEKEDQKYDCDTDTESKSHLEIIQKEIEDSMKNIKSEKSDVGMFQKSMLKVKQEEIMSEDNFRDKYNLQKMLHKDDPLQSQVDDSQGCISQNDEVMSQASFNLETEMGEPTVAQLLAFTNGNAVRWPKDKVLQIRLEHIVHAVEKNEWPIIRHTFLPSFPSSGPTPSSSSSTPMSHPPVIASPALSHRASPAPSMSSQGHSGEVTPEHTPLREPMLPSTTSIAAALQETIPPTPPEFSLLHKTALQQHGMVNQQPISESSKHRRRRRRRRFEIEAERAKLRQLLSHNMQQQQHHHQQQLQHVQQFLASSPIRNKMWEEHVEDGGKPAVPSLPAVPSPAPSASSNVPPPAHQNSSTRLPPTVGTLDLRVKSGITPPTPFTPVQPKGKPVMPVEPLAGSSTTESPTSPIDLSATSHSSSGPQTGAQTKANIGQPKSKSKKGGSRIDALALNLQARKQQQLMQDKEQHHPLADMGSMLERANEGKNKDHLDHDESLQIPPSSRHSLHHERRSLEEEETKLRKKRLQYSEESVRKSLNRNFDVTPTPAHSSFLNPSMSGGSARLNLSGQTKSEDHSGIGSGNNPLLDPSSLVHHDFKKWIDDHPELVAANPNLMAAAAAAMAFSPVSSFPSHTELLELPEGRKRGRRPRLDPTKLDYDKITGEENVSVINRLTGKKGNLPNNMNKRIVTPSEKRGRRTAASLLASAHQNLVPPVTTMSFPSTTGLNPLNFANTGMLSGFPNMKFFMDPPKSSAATTTTSATSTSTTNPPIFLPFGGLAGMGLTNPLFGFPGFNFPGLQGSSPLGTPNLPSSSAKDHAKDSEKSRGDKDSSGSSRKNTPATSTSSSLPSSSLPFLYPPGLLYNPLGLGSFTIPPNLPASFGSFTQSGLVNGLGLGSNPLFTTSSLGTTLSSPMATVTSPSVQSILSSSAMVPPVSKIHTSATKLPAAQSHFNDGQETDDESLKSLMGNHDDDDDDLDDKMEVYDNLDKDDSDRETFRDVGRSPAAVVQTSSSKTTNSDSESVCLAKTSVENPSLENKTRGTHDDPTSDSTDTESKHS